MEQLFAPVNWDKLLTPNMSLGEIIFRATAVYFVLLFLLHLLRRQAGKLAITDLLLIVLVGNATQSALAADAVSAVDGLLIAIVIVLWNYAIDFGASRISWLGKFLHPPSQLLIENGRYLFNNMRKEFITKVELESQLREAGVENISDVKKAFLEGDGYISIIKKAK